MNGNALAAALVCVACIAAAVVLLLAGHSGYALWSAAGAFLVWVNMP